MFAISSPPCIHRAVGCKMASMSRDGTQLNANDHGATQSNADSGADAGSGTNAVSGSAGDDRKASPVRSLPFALVVMAVLTAVDQGVKIWVRQEVPLHQVTNLIPYLIDLTRVENPGISFSLLGGLARGIRIPLLITVSLAAMVAISLYWLRYRRDMHGFSELAFVLILPGAAGNLIDRMLFGTVTDYLHFRYFDTSFFVNNLADIYISVGVAFYLLGMVLRSREPGVD